ncbi:glycosyltransferase family 2 protein [Thalassotalea litorea]|uniref:glycosyltransferase family 2 protein n=1 Tax=Thalassotalea litorea TaxID=2020715 RepID=UPI0037366D31
MNRFFTRLLSFLFAPRALFEQVFALYLAARFEKQLTLKQDNLDAINKDDILLFATLYNEAHLLPQFLDHYRKLGVNHFIFIDNNSTDQGAAFVAMDYDASVFHTPDSYKTANFGMHWVNALLRRYGSNHWCLVCDIDEHLIFHHETAAGETIQGHDSPLGNLCQRLEQQQQQAFYTMMLDMYPKQDNQQLAADKAEDKLTSLLDICPYFDKTNYQFNYNKKYSSQMIRGGVRQRLLYQKTPNKAPALQKIPLVKWRPYYAYLSSMHTISPRRLNTCYRQPETGALLHFKFSPGYITKVIQEQTRRQHYDNSSEYSRYQQLLSTSAFYNEALSVAYRSPQQLMTLGFIKCQQGSDVPTVNYLSREDRFASCADKDGKTKAMKNG